MIIQIRGTSGAGKTTVMRKVMEALQKVGPSKAVYVEKRRNPLWYSFAGNPATPGRVAVLGSYHSTCGGCDTIHGYAELIKLVRERTADGYHVVMEGLLLSEDSKQTLSLLPNDIRVIFLSTPLDMCLDRVRWRREAKGNTKPLNTDNTTNRVQVIMKAKMKLEAAGVVVREASCSVAPGLVLSWLGIEC